MEVDDRVGSVESLLREPLADIIEILLAADSIATLRAIRWIRIHPLRLDRSGRLALDLTPADRLIVRFNRSETKVTLLEVITDHEYYEIDVVSRPHPGA